MFRQTLNAVVPGGRATEHAALVEALATADAEVTRQVVTLHADVARAAERRQQLQASVDEVSAHAYRLQVEASNISRASNRRRTELEHAILQAADPRIDRFVDELDQAKDRLTLQIVQRGGMSAADGHGVRRTLTSSNLEAVQTVAAAIVTARERAGALKLQTVPDVGAAIEEIRRAIPTVDQAEQRDRQEVA